MEQRSLAAAAALCLGAVFVLASAAQPGALPSTAKFITFDVPGTGVTGTIANSINDAGTVAGVYLSGGWPHGFVRSPKGVIATFDVPGARSTYVASINAAGTIAGSYQDAANVNHGFKLPAGGPIYVFNVPAAGQGGGQGTLPNAIDQAGDVTGYYIDRYLVLHGFVLSANGTLSTFDAPGAGSRGNEGTYPVAINASGAICGNYSDANFVFHGFVRDGSSVITEFDAPSAGSKFEQGTMPAAIDNAGGIVGINVTPAGPSEGFLRSPAGTIKALIVPGAVESLPRAINSAGAVTGQWLPAFAAAFSGFVTGAEGEITTFAVPGAGTAVNTGTYPTGVNEAGVIAGYYTDSNGVSHGFLRIP